MKKDDNIQEEKEPEIEEDLMVDDIEHGNNLNLDDLEKKSIDVKRIKKIDYTKRRATVDSVFDERTFFLVNQILKNQILHRIEGIISAGKEANVYLAYNNIGEEVAVKIYKIDNNTSKWMKNYIIGDPRYKKIPHNVTKIIFLWAGKEFKNLKRAYKVGLKVPKPIYVKDNILIMEYIGFKSTPAPRLKDIKDLEDPKKVFNEITDFMKILYQKANLVHADLSEFNILFHNKKPVIIDISQGVTKEHPKAEVYLVRDIKNIFNYFEKLGLKTPDPEDFYYEIINITK